VAEIPKYEQVAAELRAQIEDGRLEPGDRLPTEIELMKLYKASRTTVRNAVAKLTNLGLVVHVAGRRGGIVVKERVTLRYHASRAEQPNGHSESDSYVTEVRAQGHLPDQTFEVRMVVLEPWIARRLAQEPGATAVLRRCVRRVNGQPSSVQDSYYPLDLANEVRELMSPTDISEGTTRLLADRGHLQIAYRDETEARMPTAEDADLLQLGVGTPVLRIVRTAWTRERIARVTVTTFAGDRNVVIYTIGETSLIDEDPAL
jgi:GntR family transcriptional regulator